jgi:metallo-beta-lactamase class B
VRIFGNVYYVGTAGLTSLLITSPKGHIVIDGDLPESATQILANIRALGFNPRDVKVILNSHVHFDHAGGISALQRATRAVVKVRAPSADALRQGHPGPDDPQFRSLFPFPPVSHVRIINGGDTVRVGPLALVAHATAGHTRGGTSWSWRSCDDAGRCLDFVYADSQTPVSDSVFQYSHPVSYPTAVRDFESGFATLEHLPCDVLLTPHPSASAMFERLTARDSTGGRLVDPEACRRFVATARRLLAERLASERR